MEDPPTMPSERGEQALRRWGAAEAAEAAAADAPPMADAPVKRRLRPILAVAAGLLLAAGAGLMAGRQWGARNADAQLTAQLSSARGEIARLETQSKDANIGLAAVKSARMEAENALAAATAAHGKAVRGLEVRIAKLEADLASAPPDEVAKLNETIAGLRTALAAEKTRAASAGESLKATEARLTAANARLAKSTKDLAARQAKLTSAATELNRVGLAQQRAITAAKELNRDLLSARTGQQAMLTTFQSLYLAAAAPGQTGWAARRSAAKFGKLSGQVARLRTEAKTAEGIKLLARLEVVLIRLELLDTENALEVQSFAALVGSSGLTREIDRVLAASKEPPQVRAWLLQARLIILGGRRVG